MMSRLLIILVIALLFPLEAYAQDGVRLDLVHPALFIGVSLCLALVPMLIGVATSYLKVSIVLNMLRSGLGLQQVPGNLVIMVLSLSLTAFIMQPVFEAMASAYESLPKQQNSSFQLKTVANRFQSVSEPLLKFMKKHAGAKELSALQSMVVQAAEENALGNSKMSQTTKEDTIPPSEERISVMVLAFILSELKEAFAMGFVLLLPFLAIDLVVANILVGMGMFMVSPVMISLPLKILLFIAGDGWLLLFKGLYLSYQ
jgi:type III secretion protein R